MISIRKVSKWYGSFQVLAECSAEVAKGEVVKPSLSPAPAPAAPKKPIIGQYQSKRR